MGGISFFRHVIGSVENGLQLPPVKSTLWHRKECRNFLFPKNLEEECWVAFSQKQRLPLGDDSYMLLGTPKKGKRKRKKKPTLGNSLRWDWRREKRERGFDRCFLGRRRHGTRPRQANKDARGRSSLKDEALSSPPPPLSPMFDCSLRIPMSSQKKKATRSVTPLDFQRGFFLKP